MDPVLERRTVLHRVFGPNPYRFLLQDIMEIFPYKDILEKCLRTFKFIRLAHKNGAPVLERRTVLPRVFESNSYRFPLQDIMEIFP